jgi:AhpD family alkylhydroperoxidase
MTMEPRLTLFDNPAAARFAKYLASAGKALADSALPGATRQLVEIRASQINGCAVCVDMHTKVAAHAGESQQRLNLVAAWREAKVFTEAERAALELAEQGSRLADAAGVSATRPGRLRPSTTTTSSSARWWRSSPGSTPGTG